MKKTVRYLIICAILLGIISAYNTFVNSTVPASPPVAPAVSQGIKEDQHYYSKDDVALYLHLYSHLPANYISKKEARAKGWQNRYDYVSEICEGCVIGGDRYMNLEKRLPAKHTYYECDVDYKGKKRNEKRIIYSDDGLIYYTPDHYNTFELLYGDEQ